MLFSLWLFLNFQQKEIIREEQSHPRPQATTKRVRAVVDGYEEDWESDEKEVAYPGVDVKGQDNTTSWVYVYIGWIESFDL